VSVKGIGKGFGARVMERVTLMVGRALGKGLWKGTDTTVGTESTISQCIIAMSNVNLEHDVSEMMKEYIETTLKKIRTEVRKSNGLRDELTACKFQIEEQRKKIIELEEASARAAQEKRLEVRQRKRRDTYTKKTVCEAFGCYALHVDSPLYHAAVGFMKGSQQQNHTGKNERGRSSVAWLVKEDKEPETRCMQKDRKNLLALMVNHMYDGTIGRDIEIAVWKRKRFSTVSLARVSDMHSTFNPSALGSIAKCEGGKLKGEMGLLCSESTLRRTMDIVHDQAVQLGFSTMPEDGKGSQGLVLG